MEDKSTQKDKPVIRTPMKRGDFQPCECHTLARSHPFPQPEPAHVFLAGWWRHVYEQTLAQVGEMTTDETWERAFAEGGALSMQQVLAIAQQELQRQ